MPRKTASVVVGALGRAGVLGIRSRTQMPPCSHWLLQHNARHSRRQTPRVFKNTREPDSTQVGCVAPPGCEPGLFSSIVGRLLPPRHARLLIHTLMRGSGPSQIVLHFSSKDTTNCLPCTSVNTPCPTNQTCLVSTVWAQVELLSPARFPAGNKPNAKLFSAAPSVIIRMRF